MSLPSEIADLTLPVARAPTGHLLVAAGLEHGPTESFLVDTAASGTLLAEELQPKTGWRRVRDEMIHDGSGGAARQTVVAARLRLGRWLTPEQELTVVGLGELSARLGVSIGGVLGLDVLARGELCLDLTAERMSLRPEGASIAFHERKGTRFATQEFRWLEEGLIVIDLLASNSLLTAILDTGAATSVVNDLGGGLAVDVPVDVTANALGLSGLGVPASPCSLGPIRFGDLTLPPAPVYRAPLPVFEALRLADKPAMLLGVDLLVHRVFAVRFSTREAFLSHVPKV